jgi:hypothetical protein
MLEHGGAMLLADALARRARVGAGAANGLTRIA